MITVDTCKCIWFDIGLQVISPLMFISICYLFFQERLSLLSMLQHYFFLPSFKKDLHFCWKEKFSTRHNCWWSSMWPVFHVFHFCFSVHWKWYKYRIPWSHSWPTETFSWWLNQILFDPIGFLWNINSHAAVLLLISSRKKCLILRMYFSLTIFHL